MTALRLWRSLRDRAAAAAQTAAAVVPSPTTVSASTMMIRRGFAATTGAAFASPSSSSSSPSHSSSASSSTATAATNGTAIPTTHAAVVSSAFYVPRVRRALFNVPGSEERKLQKAATLKADSLVLDLEDGVAANRKGAAREMVYDALETLDLGTAEKAVRINHVGSGLELDDLNIILRSKKLEAIVIPKVENAHQIFFVSHMVDLVASMEVRRRIRLLAAIESAQGIMNLASIVASSPRLDALIFASEDYCADTGITRTPSRREMIYARQAIVTAAASQGLQAIDLVCVDYQDSTTLMEECKEGKEMGFTGKQAIHPNQLDIIQNAFTPSISEMDKANQIVEGFLKHSETGVGAFNLDGKMIDLPVVKWAESIRVRGGLKPLLSIKEI